MPVQNLPADLDFAADPDASSERMNRAMGNVNDRISALETYKPNFDALFATLQQQGQQRLTDALQPLYTQLAEFVALGTLLVATSSTSVQVETGTVVFVIDEVLRPGYAPPRWVSALNGDASAAIGGMVQSFDRTSGNLTVLAIEAYGSGTFDSWQIAPSSPPFLGAAVVDDGTLDGTSSTQSLPFVYAGQSVATRTAIADQDYAATAGDTDIQYTALTKAHVVTLAAAASVLPGTSGRLRIGDLTGLCSSTLTIVVQAAAGDLINGSSTYTISQPYGQLAVESDGTGTWVITSQTVAAPSAVDDGAI